MKHASIMRAVVVLVVVSLSTSVVAGYDDFGRSDYGVHVSDENAPTQVPRPHNDNPNDGYNWNFPGSPWSIRWPATVNGLTITGTIPGPITIGQWGVREFGMDNTWLGVDYVKTFTLEFNYAGGRPVAVDPNGIGTREGIHPARNQPTPTSDLVSETDFGTSYTLVIEFTPQPDWEFVTISNMGQGPMVMRNIKLTSVCHLVPAPGTLALLGLGGLVTRRRRW